MTTSRDSASEAEKLLNATTYATDAMKVALVAFKEMTSAAADFAVALNAIAKALEKASDNTADEDEDEIEDNISQQSYDNGKEAARHDHESGHGREDSVRMMSLSFQQGYNYYWDSLEDENTKGQ